MKAIKSLIISLISLVAFVAVVVIGGYIFVRSKYGIDLIRTIEQLKTINKSVDESALFPNAVSSADFISLQTSINSSLADNFIKYQENVGFNGYETNYSALAGVSLDSLTQVKFSEKQIGFLSQIIFYEQTGGKIQVSEKELETTVIQVDFSNITSTGNADFNIVVKVDLTPLTSSMTDFPYSLIKKYIPHSLYISSTITIEKTDAEMGYSIAHKELKINSLSAEDTADLFHTLDTVLKVGTAENLNTQIGTIATNALIGNEINKGFAYSLKGIFNTFSFETISDTDYFVLKK